MGAAPRFWQISYAWSYLAIGVDPMRTLRLVYLPTAWLHAWCWCALVHAVQPRNPPDLPVLRPIGPLAFAP